MEMKSTLYLEIILLINDGGKSVCLCKMVRCKGCYFTVFHQKCHNKKTVMPGWSDISGPAPASVLSRSYM